jgi:gp16 family phage-associated protein
MHTETAEPATVCDDAPDWGLARGLDVARLERRRRELEAEGFNFRAWAEANNFSKSSVYMVLSGRRSCRRGAAHNIAVLLGLKDGVVSPAQASAG